MFIVHSNMTLKMIFQRPCITGLITVKPAYNWLTADLYMIYMTSFLIIWQNIVRISEWFISKIRLIDFIVD